MAHRETPEPMGSARRLSSVRDSIILLRPRQYVKNLFIFLPLFFGGLITEAGLLLGAFWAFLAFCMLASGVYIFNDWHDIGEDRLHPAKKDRPLASGRMSKSAAFPLMAALLSSGLLAGYLLDRLVFSVMVLYLLLNLGYTLKLKRLPVLDVSVIAVGFVIRLFSGSLATGVELSMWIVVVTFLLALFLALAKRREDVLSLTEAGGGTRVPEEGYSIEALNSSMLVIASAVIVSYIMYTVSPEVTARLGTDKLYFTAGFVVLGIMRYLQLAFGRRSIGSPTDVLLEDRFIQAVILCWLAVFGIFLYR